MAERNGQRRLGWLGTGRMGISLVHRLLAAGCDVTVYNRTRAKADPLAAAGAKVTDSATGLAAADIIFVTVGTSQDLVVVTQSLAEVTVLAEKSGVSRQALLACLNNSVMGSTFSMYKTPAFVNLD